MKDTIRVPVIPKMMGFAEYIQEMRSAYFQTEGQFIEISKVISIDNTPETFSPRLYNILGDSCNQVENLLRLICDRLNLAYETKNFPGYYKVLNQTGILQRQIVDVIIGHKAYRPFVIEAGKETPSWWRAYNDTKHNLPSGYKEGNLGNTLCAMTAAYALHCIANYVTEYAGDVLKNEWWNETESTAMKTQSEFPEVTDPGRPYFIPKSKIGSNL